jgi:predicted secreted hydrolase
MLLGGCPCPPDPFYEITSPSPGVRLPTDAAPHCFGGVEWWYYSGVVTTESGLDFGVEVVIFHVPQFPLALPADLWFAHYAVIDVQAGQFRYGQTTTVGLSPSAATPGTGFDLSTPLIRMRGGAGEDVITAALSDGEYALELVLHDTHGPVLHGGDGYVPYGADGRSFYYSRPRMDAHGTLRVGALAMDVSGRLWFDRQWGLDLTDPGQRWNWFSIRLDDGTDIMLMEFPGHDGLVAFGTVLPPSGPAYPLARDGFRVTPSARWTSPATGVAYGVDWEVELSGQSIVLDLTAVLDDTEFDARATTRNVYWEGLCTVTGRVNDQPVAGTAYVEQVNGGPLSP